MLQVQLQFVKLSNFLNHYLFIFLFYLDLRKQIKIKRITWTTPEKHTVRRLFAKEINNRRLPSSSQTQNAIAANPELQRRTVAQVRLWISNHLKKDNIPLSTSSNKSMYCF